MSLRSHLNSKTLTLLFVVCCLISGYFNIVQWRQRWSLREDQASAQADLVEERDIYQSLQKGIAANSGQATDIANVDQELVGLIVAAKSELPDQMITLSALSVSHSGATTKGTPLPTLFMPIARTNGLKSTTVRLTGKYQNLRLLEGYIANLKKAPIILSGMSLQQDTFVLNVQLIGK